LSSYEKTMAVTVPGGSTTVTGANVTVAPGTGDVLHLAAQIGALLATIQGTGALPTSSGLSVSTVTGAVITAPTPPGSNAGGTATELVFNPLVATAATVPVGWDYVVNTGVAGSTLTGANTDFIGGSTSPGAYFVSGNSTVAAEGGNNTVTASGNYLLSFGADTAGGGANAIFVDGTGTVATGGGTSTIVASAGSNTITAGGTGDLVVAAGGDAIILSSENGLGILGAGPAGGTFLASITGNNATVSTANSTASVSASGSNNDLVAGTGTTNFVISGLGDTITSGTPSVSGAETVSALGTSNPIVFGGTGPLSFVGGAGTATIVGGSGGSTAVTVGSGGVVFSAGVNDTSTVTGGTTQASIFGGSGSVVNFFGNDAGGLFLAGAGNETLNAALSTTSNLLAGGTVAGSAVSLVGGAGSDTLFAGSGADTLSAGAGSNDFAFFQGATSGNNVQDFVTDFSANDTLFLVGYDSAQSAASVLAGATSGANGVTLTLSDNTKITFTNLTDTSTLNGKINYIG